MKALKTILVALIPVLMSTTINAQTLEGKWMGSNPAGEYLRVEFKPDNTIYFNLNGIILNTVEFEAFYNMTPNQVLITYHPNAAANKSIRYKAGLFEFVNANQMNFVVMESDGNVFPVSLQGAFSLQRVNSWTHSPHPNLDDL